MEVKETPLPCTTPDNAASTASCGTEEEGTGQQLRFSSQGKSELETPLINCIGSLTKLANELCSALQDMCAWHNAPNTFGIPQGCVAAFSSVMIEIVSVLEH